MARRKPSHRGFRTKEVIASDVAFVLNAPLSLGTKLAVVNQACWTWTEFDGKYSGCRFWSQQALDRKSEQALPKLIHEHLVPRAVVADLLLAMHCPSAKDVFQVFDKYLIAVIVTPEEDKKISRRFRSKMPMGFFDLDSPDFQNVWLRYKDSEISVVDTTSL